MASSTRTCSAQAPLGIRAAMRSPGRKLWTDGPTESTSPDSSRPGIGGDRPENCGRCGGRSSRDMEKAWTRISSWEERGEEGGSRWPRIRPSEGTRWSRRNKARMMKDGGGRWKGKRACDGHYEARETERNGRGTDMKQVGSGFGWSERRDGGGLSRAERRNADGRRRNGRGEKGEEDGDAEVLRGLSSLRNELRD